MTKSILCGCYCQNNFVVVLSLLLVCSKIQSNNVVSSQTLINHLAALLRSRSPWPTTFPSGTTTTGESGQNEASSFTDMISNQIGKDLKFEDFNHFNDLLTGQSINNAHNHEGNAGNGGDNLGMSFQQLYPGANILATSHPLAQLEMPNPNGNGKAVLIAHPVLGPNPNEPPEKVDHKFNSMMVNPMNLLNDNNAGLYPETSNNQNPNHAPRPSAVRYTNNNDRLKNSFQNFAQNLFFPNSNSKNHKPKFQNMIPMSGKPPPGGKIIAIPVQVPSNSPLLKNQFFNGVRHAPQIIAVRQPFPPMTSVPTHTPQTYPTLQHVTSFMGKFSPSPLDVSSLSPTTNLTTMPSFTTVAATNATTSASSTTAAMSTPTATIVTHPPLSPTSYQSHFNFDQTISSSSNERHYSSSSTVTTQSPTTSTSTSTTTPKPHNNIQDVIQNSDAQNSIHSSPSTQVGSFRYPDPPTPPRMLNMNTRYELQTQDVLNSHRVQPLAPQPSQTTTTTKSAYYSPSKNGNNNANGFFSSPISSNASLIASPSLKGSRSKWKYEDSSISASDATSTNIINFSRQNSDQVTNHKSGDPSFKPSPQLHSFEDTTSGLVEFITLSPIKKKSRASKSLFQSTTTSRSSPGENVDLPEIDSGGFRPFNYFAFVNGKESASVSSTTESSMMNLLRNEFNKNVVTDVWSNVDPTPVSKIVPIHGIRQNRQFFSAAHPSNGYANSKPFYAPSPAATSITVGASYSGSGYPFKNDYKSHKHSLNSDWVGKSQFPFTTSTTGPVQQKKAKHHQTQSTTATTSSSELYEDWLMPTTKRKKESKDHHKDSSVKSNTSSYSISTSSGRFKSPPECDKYHRFGFCPVTSHYPLGKIESIGLRCSALLSHLIAPLPKTDVRYDVIVPKNSNHSSKGKSSSFSESPGWSWKTFAGKPVCDTKEVKIVPGWAKNEKGEWLIILQTKEWKQEAQISLCSQNSDHGKEDAMKMKCVQRFTAQRLVVLDPENEDRCPVVRSVFLPSACVCLNDEEKKSKHTHNHHRHHRNGQSQHHNHNSTKPNSSNTSNKKSSISSKTISGRSLFTSLFGLDFDHVSDENHEITNPTSASQQDSRSDAKSSEESRNPLNPSNSHFMAIAPGESSTESGDSRELRPGPSKRSIISSNLGSSFILSDGSGSSHDRNNDSINRIRNGDHLSSQRNTGTDPNG